MAHRIHKMWTKGEMSDLVKLWNTTDMEVLERKLGRSKATIQGMLKKMRSAGIDIPKKRVTGYIDTLVKDFARELKGR